MRNLIVFSLAILYHLILTGCKKQDIQTSSLIKLQDTLLVDIPESYYFNSKYTTINVPLEGYEYSYLSENYIYIIDIENPSNNITLKFEVEGNNGVKNIMAHYLSDNESIYLVPRSSNKIYQTDTNKSVINSIDLSEKMVFCNSNSCCLTNNQYFVSIISEGKVKINDTNFIEINTYDNSKTILKLGFPENYIDKWVSPYFTYPIITHNATENNIYILYPGSDELRIYNIPSGDVQVRKLPYFEKFSNEWNSSKIELKENSKDNLISAMTTPRIQRFMYDKYRDMYIVIYNSIEIFSGDNKPIERNNILLLDSELNFVDDMKLDYNYNISEIFITKMGVYINYGLSEDVKIFHRFTYPQALPNFDELELFILTHMNFDSASNRVVIIPAVGCANCIKLAKSMLTKDTSAVPENIYLISKLQMENLEISDQKNVIPVDANLMDFPVDNPIAVEILKGSITSYYHIK